MPSAYGSLRRYALVNAFLIGRLCCTSTMQVIWEAHSGIVGREWSDLERTWLLARSTSAQEAVGFMTNTSMSKQGLQMQVFNRWSPTQFARIPTNPLCTGIHSLRSRAMHCISCQVIIQWHTVECRAHDSHIQEKQSKTWKPPWSKNLKPRISEPVRAGIL